jgi:hypothetical protein
VAVVPGPAPQEAADLHFSIHLVRPVATEGIMDSWL